jgi:predicted nucleic-acid-binding Zn-ribbon protein
MLRKILENVRCKEKFIKQFEENEVGTIVEATFKRVVSAIQNNTFAMITASRGNYTKSENKKRNKQLLQDLREILGTKTVGAYPLVGHWKECSVELPEDSKISDCEKLGGKLKDSLEQSWLVNKPEKVSEEDFFNACMKVAKKYEQDGFVFKGESHKFAVYTKDGKVDFAFSKNPDDESITLGFEKIIDLQGFSQYKKDRDNGLVRNIVFETYFVLPKSNISSKRAFPGEYGLSFSTTMVENLK